METLQSSGNPQGGRWAREIMEMGPWFQNLHLPGGIETAPDHPLGDYPSHRWETFQAHLPADLHGWTALDIGCNAGYYSFELARRGAQVVAIDSDPHYLRQARWASEIYGLKNKIEFRQQQVYDLAHRREKYDLVLFLGVFYHLRYPMFALDAVVQCVNKKLVFQSLSIQSEGFIQESSARVSNLAYADRKQLDRADWPKMAFIEDGFAGDRTNWWVPNRPGVEAMLRSTGMEIVAAPDAEIFVCRPSTEFLYRVEFSAAAGNHL